MKLLWTVAAFLCFHWEDVSAQIIPTGTCDCATFARNNLRPKRPLVTWPAGDTSCSASSVARCRLECNKFFRTFEFDALDLVCGSLHEANRVQILFGYRICKSKWHSLGLSEEPICCHKSRPIHCDSLEASRRQANPHTSHGEQPENKRKAAPKKSTNKNESDKPEPVKEPEGDDEDEQNEESSAEDKKKSMKKPDTKSKPTLEEPKKTTKKPEKEEQVTKKPTVTPKPKDKAQSSSQEEAGKPEQEMARRSSSSATGGGGSGSKNKPEAESEDTTEEEEEDDIAEDEDKPVKKAKKGQAQKLVMRKRQRTPQKHDEEE